MSDIRKALEAAGKIAASSDEGCIRHFMRESNAIEGILRSPTNAEVRATRAFINIDAPTVQNLVDLVGVYQPDAVLRERKGLNVCVGEYLAPPGGPAIRADLEMLLWSVRNGGGPYETHLRYERLHPFTDGNGRSGRALWLWQMWRQGYRCELSFLHKFYYQTLENSGRSEVRNAP